MAEISQGKPDLLRDRYETLSTLGSGGEARVMKALDHQHDRLVALKIRVVRSAHARDELLREARVLLQIPPHQALPLVREDFFDGDEYVVAMDWVDGTDLDRILRDRGNPGLAPSSVIAYLAEAAEALTFLHANGVIHGDVKPANLILTRGGHVQLVDFGMSSTLGMRGHRLGTAGYRAPEIMSGGAPTRATDVYSLAATAFALLTGAPPAGVLPSWQGVDPDLAAHLEAALRAGLATDPGRRPATPGELVETLRAGWGSTLPTGVMTFLMTDIAGSTMLWEKDPQSMAEALVRHDELIASVVEASGGRFLKSKGEGDSTVSVFESARSALDAAIEGLRALRAEAWPGQLQLMARFGLHTGEAEARDGDYFGPTINRAARLRAQADGGEILVSDTTTRVLQRQMPKGYDLVDLGLFRLKGVEAPEHIRAIRGPEVDAPLPATDCPYRGLLSFEERDKDYFFGREAVVASLRERVAPDRLLAVVGASGSGKSSLVRAGLMAAVHGREIAGVDKATLCTPGAVPPERLEGDARTLVIIDQFEELYTVCEDDERRARFIAAVLEYPGPVVICVRADFYGDLAGHQDLAAAVAENQVLLGAMTDEQLRRAVAEPARLAGLRFETGLVDLILRDVAGEPGALPLLSHALRSTWERRDGRTLTVEAYRASGGVSSAVAQSADAVAADIEDDGRDLLRSIFLRLTELGEGTEDTRRRVPISDLVPQGMSPGPVRSLLDRLADARLLTLGDGTAEVAHEVLIREWPLLRRWLDEDRAGIRLHRALGDAARLWDGSGRSPGDLYRGARLAAAVDWADEHPSLLNAMERDFLDAGVAADNMERERQARSTRRLRRTLATAAGLLVVSLCLLAFALVSRHDTAQQRTSAQSRGLAAEAQNQLGSDPELSLLLARRAVKTQATPDALFALRAALDASAVRGVLPAHSCPSAAEPGAPHLAVLGEGPLVVESACDDEVAVVDPRSRKTVRLLDAVANTSPDGNAAPISADPAGKSVAIATKHGVKIADAATGSVIKTLGSRPADVVTYSPDGQRLATHFEGQPLVVYDTRGWTPRALGETPRDSYVRILFTPGGRRVAIVSSDPAKPGLRIYDAATGRLVRNLGPATMAAISPDGRRLAVSTQPADAGVVTIWAGAGFRQHSVLARFPLIDASALDFSPDGARLAIGVHDGGAGVWSLGDKERIVGFAGNHSRVSSIVFDSDGKNVVTAVVGGTAKLWSASGSEDMRAPSSGGEPSTMAVDPQRIAAAYYSGEIGVWDRRGNRLTSYRLFHGNAYQHGFFWPALSPDGSLVAYQHAGGQNLHVIKVSDRKEIRTLPRIPGGSGAFSPDDTRVAYFSPHGEARITTLSDGHTISLAGADRGASCGGYTAPSFTPDGRLVGASTFCGDIAIWNAATGRLTRLIKSPDVVFSAIAFSHDGSRVAWGSTDTTISVASLRTGKRVEVLHGQPGSVASVTFSLDDRRVVTAGLDRTVRVWDLKTGRTLRVVPGPDFAPLVTPDGKDIVATDHTGTVSAIPVCPSCGQAKALLTVAATRITRTFTTQERKLFLNGF